MNKKNDKSLPANGLDSWLARAEQRSRRFASKVNLGGSAVSPEHVRAMCERYQVQARLLSRVEEAVARVCNPAGIPLMLRFWYTVFAKQVYGLRRRSISCVYESEAPLLRLKWTNRSLDPMLLRRIEDAVLEVMEAEEPEPGMER